MTGVGRPLRFLAAVAGGWVTLRVVMLWPQIDSVAALAEAVVPVAAARPAAPPTATAPVGRSTPDRITRWQRVAVGPSADSAIAPDHPKPDPHRVALALIGMVRFNAVARRQPGLIAGLPARAPTAPGSSRWSGSAWMLVRGQGAPDQTLLGGQLGGSQAGARIAYTLDTRRRIMLAGRISTPLGAGLREASLGVEWQPTRLPVRFVAERRFAIEGGKSAFAAGVVGGFGPLDLPAGFRLEGYGQAGAIDRDEIQGFADGAVRVARPVATIGRLRIDLGAGVWGGVQRGASRIDLGPSIGVVVPLARQPVRVSLDWRQRVVGGASPGSGPALSLGADF